MKSKISVDNLNVFVISTNKNDSKKVIVGIKMKIIAIEFAMLTTFYFLSGWQVIKNF